MPTLSSGSSVAVPLPAGSCIVVGDSCAGYATITSGSNSGQQLAINYANEVLGPFAETCNVSVSCVAGSMAYNVMYPAADPASVATSTQLLRGDDPRLMPYANTFAFVGDSRLAQMHVDSPKRNKHSVHWFNHANALMGQRMRNVYNGAVSGWRSDQYIPVGLDGAIASGAQWLVIWGVVNDISFGVTAAQAWNGWASGAGPVGASDSHIGIKAAAQRALVAGMRVILLTDPGSTSMAGNATLTGECLRYNRYVREFAEQTKGVLLFDVAREVWNPTSTNLTWKTGYSVEGSNVQTHLATLGGYNCGVAFASLMSPILPAFQQLPAARIETNANGGVDLTPNPLWLTTTGGTVGTGFTGTMPAGWEAIRSGSGNPTATLTLQDAADGVGKELVVACTFNAADDEIRIRCTNSLASSLSLPAAGDILQAGGEVSVANSSSSFCGVYLQLQGDPSGSNYEVVDMYCGSAYGAGPTTAYNQVQQTYPVQFAAAPSTYLRFSFRAVAFAAGTATFTIRKPWLRKRLSA